MYNEPAKWQTLSSPLSVNFKQHWVFSITRPLDMEEEEEEEQQQEQQQQRQEQQQQQEKGEQEEEEEDFFFLNKSKKRAVKLQTLEIKSYSFVILIQFATLPI